VLNKNGAQHTSGHISSSSSDANVKGMPHDASRRVEQLDQVPPCETACISCSHMHCLLQTFFPMLP
jgi:hypothetical protein